MTIAMTIRRRGIAAAALALASTFAASASATVLGFDDIVGVDGSATLPASYGGLDWSASSWFAFSGAQEPYTAHSGTGRVALGWGAGDADSTIRFQSNTVFDGAWFSGYTDASVRFDLYAGGQLVASSTTITLSNTPIFLSSGWTGAVDSVVVSSSLQSFYAMDDFTFHAAAVPEPATLALMLAGVGLVGVAARRRRG